MVLKVALNTITLLPPLVTQMLLNMILLPVPLNISLLVKGRNVV